MSVLVSKASLSLSISLSLRILFFWEALRGKLSCFHVKGVLLSVCFPGCLKLFTVPGGLSVSVCIRVYLCMSARETPNRRWCKMEVEIWHRSLNASLHQERKYFVPSTGQNLAMAYLSLITKSCHWSSAKCWHKISQTCRWPFWASQSREGQGTKLAKCVVEIIPPWHFRDLGPLVFSIPVEEPRENVTFFIYLGEYAN